jgi:hypothetical protein
MFDQPLDIQTNSDTRSRIRSSQSSAPLGLVHNPGAFFIGSLTNYPTSQLNQVAAAYVIVSERSRSS